MRNRLIFLAGFAAGFVAGARAGRERYEQMKKFGRRAMESPAVQQATRAAGAKATELTKAAGQRAAERMPKISETAKTGADKVRRRLDRMPGRHSGQSEHAGVNGTRPGD